jgi:hypothetical protein
MYIENAFFGFHIVADLALVAVHRQVVEFRKSENELKKFRREKHEETLIV